MRFYIDSDNNVYAYEDDCEEKFIAEGLTPITENEANEILNPPPTKEELIAAAEYERQQLLTYADAVMLDWRTELMLGEISDTNRAKLSAWLAYKNEVKSADVTTGSGRVNWPAPPEA
ncbi:tail fiber assembly protein [Citrobacter portucalensis]|uniref:tail fiber assembly protein n=1 Tax=Citrobacter portucalensis TaxID=1639133 RepID=UPI002B3B6512|nr:tail fiber assembly protein [Citrobacter portucalensis]MEB2744293.1 tail fiber assembly protein [Citrobacter portucalensis]